MRELLSAGGHDGGLIRLLVCGDQAARVNQRQADPSSPGGFTLSLPHTEANAQQQQSGQKSSSHTPTLHALV